MSKRLTAAELIARIKADVAALEALVAAQTAKGPSEGEEPTDRY